MGFPGPSGKCCPSCRQGRRLSSRGRRTFAARGWAESRFLPLGPIPQPWAHTPSPVPAVQGSEGRHRRMGALGARAGPQPPSHQADVGPKHHSLCSELRKPFHPPEPGSDARKTAGRDGAPAAEASRGRHRGRREGAREAVGPAPGGRASRTTAAPGGRAAHAEVVTREATSKLGRNWGGGTGIWGPLCHACSPALSSAVRARLPDWSSAPVCPTAPGPGSAIPGAQTDLWAEGAYPPEPQFPPV